MKLTTLATALLALGLSTASFAGKLNTENGVELVALDGVKVAKSTNSVALTDNKVHQVVVEVSDIIDGDYYSVDPMILTFTAPAEDVVLSTPKLTSKRLVEDFKNALNFTLATTSGKAVNYTLDKLTGEGFAPNARVEDNLAKYNASQSKASVNDFANASLEKKGQIVVKTSDVKLEQLQLLYKKADEETKKRFLAWAKAEK